MYSWGNPLWHLLYHIAKDISPTINTTERRLLIMFYHHIPAILPCQKCHKHYREFLNTNPLSIDSISKEYLLDWLYRLDISIMSTLFKKGVAKDTRISSMGETIDYQRISTLFINLRNYFFLNTIEAKQLYIFIVYISILLPDKPMCNKIKNILDNDQFDKHVFQKVIELFGY